MFHVYNKRKIRLHLVISQIPPPFIFILLFFFGRQNDDTTYIPE